MLVTECRTRIHAPLGRVRDVLADIRQWPRYSQKARTLEIVDGEPERVRVSGHFAGRPFTVELVIRREGDSGFRFETTGMGSPLVRGAYHARMEDGFATLVHREEWSFRGAWRERLWSRHIQLMTERESALFKQHVELAFVNDLLGWRQPAEPVYTITMLEDSPVAPKPKAGPKAGFW